MIGTLEGHHTQFTRRLGSPTTCTAATKVNH